MTSKGSIADFIFNQEEDTEEFRDSISTVDKEGKRVWVYPKKPEGFFTRWRQYVSYVLLAVLILMPFVRIGGEPLFLFNVLERRFVLFGQLFMPQDFHLFVFAMLTLTVFIILFTVVFGRIFCGWICPQTIFMEEVFRRIEYWIEGDANAQRRLAAAPWTAGKVGKKLFKFGIFYAIAVLISNVFLAYIIGSEEVIRITTEPISEHTGGFIAMLTFAFVFFFVFAYLREQVCIVICPYGRLQGVLLDRDTIVVAYDFVRGEPRTKLKKPKADDVTNLEKMATVGDCIDCKLCVQVCPTGIDIRHGTQLECINCTACIDACDAVMGKVNRPAGLIRYDSYHVIAEGKKRRFTPRMMAYTGVLLALIGFEVFLLNYRQHIETLVLRTPGKLYQQVEDNRLSNLYNFQVINKTATDYGKVEFRLVDSRGEIKMIGQPPALPAGDKTAGSFFIILDRADVHSHKNRVVVEVIVDGEVVQKVKTNFLGPM